jgi:hypothetical protein
MPKLKLVLAAVGVLGIGVVLAIVNSAKGPAANGQTVDGRAALWNVAAGQVPNDIGSDRADNVKMTIEECPELGGKALKVAFASPDSFGDRQARVQNWTGFATLQFEAFNPAAEKIPLTFTLKHRGTTNYSTRVDVPVALVPGKSTVRIAIGQLTNVNGSAPDLTAVRRWYFGLERSPTVTFYLGSLWLVKEGAAPAESRELAPARPTGAAGELPAGLVGGQVPAATRPMLAPGQRYRVTGKIGDAAVDLLITPDETPAPSAPSPATHHAPPTTREVPPATQHSPPTTSNQPPAGDPARLARIRAAKMPAITRPVLFNTPEADAILSALEVFPPDNSWNQVISDWPLHPNSSNIIASIGPEKPFRYNPDMGFILVPADQKPVDVKLRAYSAESDKGPYPVPDEMPIEGWPAGYPMYHGGRTLSLDQSQRDALKEGGDRHAIVVDPAHRMLYEFYQAQKTDSGWEASGAAIFDLKSNKLRPDGWTSTDAAGLPIFPAVVRYDELQRGIVEHAMRVTVKKTCRAYVAPATHFASQAEDENLPRMGERLRLRQDFDVSGFSAEVQAILKGLKKYGMFVADNGIDWAISVAPDQRIPNLHRELRRIQGSAFEVVQPPN